MLPNGLNMKKIESRDSLFEAIYKFSISLIDCFDNKRTPLIFLSATNLGQNNVYSNIFHGIQNV